MASKIILKKSSVAAKAPVAGDLEFGELAINYTDSKLYFKKADGSIDAFTSAAASAPVTSVGGNIGAVTDAQLLASIKNVDGTGSGLDADFLDGLNASAFYLASNPNGYTSNTGTVTSVGATAPLVSSGGNTPSISIPAANSTTNGYMSSAYAAKLDGIAAGATNVTNTNQLTNGAGYITSAALASYLPLTGGTLTGSLFGTTITATFESSNARFKFKAADAYSGSYAIIGLDWGGAVGTYKNLAVYDYVNGRSVVEFIGDTRAVNIFGTSIVSTNSWAKWVLETTGTTAKARQGSDANGLNFTSNALWNGAWVEDDTTKKKFAYIQHLGNGRHEFRTAAAGAGVSWVTSLTIDDTAVNSSVALTQGGNQVLHAGNHTSYSMPSGSSATNSVDIRAPIFYDSNDTGYYIDPSSYSRIRQLTLTQARVDSSKYPVGHYAPGEEVFAIDPTWTQDQLREYFNSNNVSWVADSTAPGGYAIQLTGAINVGGVYGSGFPYIPVETDDTFYMEVYIKNVTGSNTHYMGSMDFNHNFTNLGGNPGSFGYWVMSNSNPGTGWTKYSGYISGFGTATGQFVSGTEYWTPQALFNYSAGGTSYISGWKVLKLTKGIVGRFPNSTVNTGEAWYGRANDRNRGTYTIQLGGNSASGRQFEVVDYAWSTVMFRVDSANFSESAGSSRAPIFYDSNNTGYYVDPASTSNLAGLTVANTINGSITGNAATATSADQIDGVGFRNTGSNSGINADTIESNGITYYTAGVTNFSGNASDGALYSQAYSSAWQHQIAGDYRSGQIAVRGKNSGTWQSWRKILQEDTWQGSKYFGSDGAIYGTIFYDANNGAYYCDPTATSRLGTVNADTLRSYNNIYLDNQYGSSVIGVYSSVRYQGVFSMGDAYKLPLDGTTTGNLYGLAWSHPNAGGTAGNLNTHGLLVLENGGFLAAVSGSIRSRDDMRSPIFYDSNNTAYYSDPNGNSRFARTDSDEIYNYGWFRNHEINEGLYNQATGCHFYSNGGASWGITGTGGNVELQFRSNHQSTVRGYVYGDTSSNFGLLNQNGSWKVRVNGSDTEIYDYMYFNDGRGYIFYDRSNTGYYVDPNSTTYIYYLQSATTVRADSDRRLKENITPITSALSLVRQLQGCRYTRNDLADKTKVYIGMIAQDVLPIVPEVVSGSEAGKYSLGYAELVPVLNEAVKELDEIVSKQAAIIAKLEERLSKLLDD